jgi:hypothetical protein
MFEIEHWFLWTDIQYNSLENTMNIIKIKRSCIEIIVKRDKEKREWAPSAIELWVDVWTKFFESCFDHHRGSIISTSQRIVINCIDLNNTNIVTNNKQIQISIQRGNNKIENEQIVHWHHFLKAKKQLQYDYWQLQRAMESIRSFNRNVQSRSLMMIIFFLDKQKSCTDVFHWPKLSVSQGPESYLQVASVIQYHLLLPKLQFHLLKEEKKQSKIPDQQNELIFFVYGFQ